MSQGVRVTFDVVDGVVGATSGTVTAATINSAGSGLWKLEVQGLGGAVTPDHNWVTLNNTNTTTTETFSCPNTQGIEYSAVPGDLSYFAGSRVQQIGDEGPRAAHLVQATPGNQPDYNAWDASGSQGGIAGARNPAGFSRYMDAVDAVLGGCLNAPASYVVWWWLDKLGTTGDRTALWVLNNAGNSGEYPLWLYAEASARRRRLNIGDAAWSTAPSTALSSKVIAMSSGNGTLYENGALLGTSPPIGGTMTADRLRLWFSNTTTEQLFLGGGVFVFSSADAMTAALPFIHAMVAYMRALWGL